MMISGDFQAMALVLGKFKEMIIHKAFFFAGKQVPPPTRKLSFSPYQSAKALSTFCT